MIYARLKYVILSYATNFKVPNIHNMKKIQLYKQQHWSDWLVGAFHQSQHIPNVLQSDPNTAVAFLAFWNLSEHLLNLYYTCLAFCTVVIINELEHYSHRNSCCVVQVQWSVLTNKKDHFVYNFKFSIRKSVIRT